MDEIAERIERLLITVEATLDECNEASKINSVPAMKNAWAAHQESKSELAMYLLSLHIAGYQIVAAKGE